MVTAPYLGCLGQDPHRYFPDGWIRRSPGDEHREAVHMPPLLLAARRLKEVSKLIEAGQ